MTTSRFVLLSSQALARRPLSGWWQALSLALVFLAGCGGGGGGGGGTPAASEGSDSSSSSGGASNWLIPVSQVVDGGPGKDGIPSIDNPIFVPIAQAVSNGSDLVIGIQVDGEMRAIPLDILDWHEVLNERTQDGPVVLSYCPLTGSTLFWESSASNSDPTFGVSGLLYKSNLILYDRQTDSNWSQMEIQSVQGTRRGEVPRLMPVAEMTFGAWLAMYPDSTILSRQTGFERNYDRYPYGTYRTDNELLFRTNPEDDRLHKKTRVVGVEVGSAARAYVISEFASPVDVINDTIADVPIVVMGSADSRFGVVFERTLGDGTTLTFGTTDEALPAIAEDDEGNTWDIFGQAIAGPRAGEKLPGTKSHIAYWFAWGAFHPDSEIFGRN